MENEADPLKLITMLRSGIARQRVAAAVLPVVTTQPHPPRAIDWRQVLRVASAVPGGFAETVASVPLIGVVALMLETLPTDPPPPGWRVIPAVAALACAGAAAWELQTAWTALRRHPLQLRTVDAVETLYESPSGYEPIGAFRGVSIQWKGSDGSLARFEIAADWATRFYPGLRLLGFQIGRRVFPIDVAAEDIPS